MAGSDKMTALLDTETDASQGRTLFAVDTPIFYILGWLVVAYFAIYFVTFYAGPLLFGTRPYRPYPYARQMHHVTKREAKMTDQEDFISRISNYLNYYDN